MAEQQAGVPYKPTPGTGTSASDLQALSYDPDSPGIPNLPDAPVLERHYGPHADEAGLRGTRDGRRVNIQEEDDEKLGVVDKGEGHDNGGESDGVPLRNWDPLCLSPWFIVPWILITVGVAIGLEIALHFSKVSQGWAISSPDTNSGAYHYLYTIPPVALSLPLVAIWGWIDFSVKKMQPYIDLSNGNATPERSILLNYVDQNKFFVWYYALRNRHYIATVTTLICLLTLVVQPIAGGLFVVRETLYNQTDWTIKSLASLAVDSDYINLVPFVTAAGFTEAVAVYGIPNPTFVQKIGGESWAVSDFEVPNDKVANGTISAYTVGVISKSNCNQADAVTVSSSTTTGSAAHTISALWRNCTCSFTADGTSATQFGAGLVDCGDSTTPAEFKNLGFWLINVGNAGTGMNGTNANGTVSFCSPQIEVWDVLAGVDLASKKVVNVTKVGQRVPGTANTDSVMGLPLLGRAFNSYAFNLTTNDQYIIQRANATQSILPSSIYEAVIEGKGLPAAFLPVGPGQDNLWNNLTSSLYELYLSLVASKVYFSPQNNTMRAFIIAPEPRLWMADPATHIIVVVLLIISLAGFFVHFAHLPARRDLKLAAEPGTLASVVSIAGDTDLARLLESRDSERTQRWILRGLRFKLDKKTGKIVPEGNAVSVAEQAGEGVKRRDRTRRSGMSIYRRKDEDEGYLERERRKRLSRLSNVASPGTSPTSPDTRV